MFGGEFVSIWNRGQRAASERVKVKANSPVLVAIAILLAVEKMVELLMW